MWTNLRALQQDEDQISQDFLTCNKSQCKKILTRLHPVCIYTCITGYSFLSGVIFPNAYCAFIQGKNGDKRKRSNSSKRLWCWVKQKSAPLALSQLILSILNKLIVPPALLFTAAVLPLVTVDGGCFLRNALFRCRENNRNIWKFCQRLPVKGVDTWAEPRSPTQSAVRMWVNQICQAKNLTFDNKTKLIMQYAFPNSPLTSEAKQKLLSGIT